MITREHIHSERADYTHRYRKRPTLLLLSLDAHDDLLKDIRQFLHHRDIKSLHGYKYMEMDIHVVPSLQGSVFKVA